MSISIRLLKIKCLEESTESSTADEPFVLVTSVRLTTPPTPPVTARYGEWTNFDKGEERTLSGEQPFWGLDGAGPEAIVDPNAVCFIVSLIEHDDGNIDAYRGAAQTAAAASLAGSLGLPRPTRVSRLLNDIRSAIGILDFPSLDDHIETKELRFNVQDLGLPGDLKDKTLTFDGGNEGKYELTFRLVHHHRVVFDTRARLTALSRRWDFMELWAVGLDGLLHGNWFYGRWHGWYTLPGHNFPPVTHVAAVNRHEDHSEVWAVANDGAIWGNWSDGKDWQGWYRLSGPDFTPGGPIAAVSRHSNHMEVWAITRNGTLVGRRFEGSQWQNWVPLNEQPFPADARMAAVSKSADHMQLWVSAAHQPIQDNVWDAASEWGGWRGLDGETFPVVTEMTAIKRETLVHLFAVNASGQLKEFLYDDEGKRQGWHAVSSVFPGGAPVAAVSRRWDRMEAWSGNQNGLIQGCAFEAGWQNAYSLPGMVFVSPTPLTALSRTSEHMEVWGVSGNIVRGNWFLDEAWHDWYALEYSFDG